jgi:hypothetical protein
MAFERVLLDFTVAFTDGFADAFTGFADPLLLLLKGLKGFALFTFGLGALFTFGLGALFTLLAEAAEVILIVSPGFMVYSRTTGILFIRNKI